MAHARRRDQDGWTGSWRRPWMNPPREHGFGAGRGSWRWGMAVIVAAVVLVLVVLVLVRQDVLPREWAYVVLPVAIVAAAASRVITIFKAGAEENRPHD